MTLALVWTAGVPRFLVPLVGLVGSRRPRASALGGVRTSLAPGSPKGRLGAPDSAHEMLLQRWGEVVRSLPAVSARWRDVSFRELRREGRNYVVRLGSGQVLTGSR